jgi:hypothetical protein
MKHTLVLLVACVLLGAAAGCGQSNSADQTTAAGTNTDAQKANESAANAWQDTKSAATNGWNVAKYAATNAWNAAKQGATNVWDKTTNAAKKM